MNTDNQDTKTENGRAKIPVQRLVMWEPNERVVCECGNDRFFFFGDFARCPECGCDFKQIVTETQPNIFKIELWLRRGRTGNWEHCNKNSCPTT